MQNALRIPSAVAGALMPDAHRGYGLPIGGVLATDGTVIPYAVGVDIACRMKLSMIDLPASADRVESGHARRARSCRRRQFGVGATLARKADGDVLDDGSLVDAAPAVAAAEGGRAARHSSGSGNHFVEFGTLSLPEADLGLPAGGVPRDAVALRQPRHRREDRRPLLQARPRAAPRAARRSSRTCPGSISTTRPAASTGTR